MAMTDDPDFYAWLDGELQGADAAAMAATVAADPALTALAAQHRALGAQLRAAFDPIAAAAVPDPLLDAARTPSASVIDFADARSKRDAAVPARRVGWGRQFAAMAAALALGLFVGPLLFTHPAGPVRTVDGHLVAAGALKQSLSVELASAPAPTGPRIALTFRDHGGAICRSFVDLAESGLACRDGDEWRIRGLFQALEGQQDSYRMAASPDPALAAMIDAQRAGDPLDSKSEQTARANHWR